MSGVEFAREYCGGEDGWRRELEGAVGRDGGVVVVGEGLLLLGWLVDVGCVFYVHLAYGDVRGLVRVALLCLGERGAAVERVRFERGGRDGDVGLRDVPLVCFRV